MTIYTCVEPAQENANAHSVVVATAADTVNFPNVDSCIALIFKLTNGTYICGHASMMPRGSHTIDMAESAEDLAHAMVSQLHGGQIDTVIIVCDANWQSHIDPLRSLAAHNSLWIDKDPPVDLHLNNNQLTISNHNTHVQLAAVAVNDIHGRQTRQI